MSLSIIWWMKSYLMQHTNEVLQEKYKNVWTLINMRKIYIRLIRWGMKILKKNMSDVTLCLNTNRTVHMVLKI